MRENPLVGIAIFAAGFLVTTPLLGALAENLPSAAGVSPVFIAAVFMTAALHWSLGFPSHLQTNGTALLMLSSLGLHLATVGAVLSYGHHRGWNADYAIFLVPHALAPMVLCMLAGRRLGFFGAFYAAILGAPLVPSPSVLQFIATALAIGFFGVFITRKVRRRSRLLTSGVYLGVFATGMMVFFGQTPTSMGSAREVLTMVAPLFCGILSVMVAGAVLPAFESLFHRTTAISWLELGDLNHPLMKRLSMEAPGTYHHSLVVANLAEAAAESINANATMCRVCSYFHDIGKLTKPEYFIENMDPENNPHDDLTARMSALVLIAHVKDGVDIAIKHSLNSAIINVIEQHHGNSLVYYFYRRALEQKKEALKLVEEDKARQDDVPDVSEDGFRYPGPRPQFKESAIISLADAVESASRTLAKPTPNRVEQLVDDIVRNRLLDHQLDECDLTLAELSDIKTSFVKTLMSMMHSRIKYPKETTEKTRDEEVRKQARDLEKPSEHGVGTKAPARNSTAA
ncbi:MAG TPA: HDIG domain-containing protein [Candidatus Saccharimonadia bacterium]|nr:HDIG domain-containing protein [Candidatus Saccharimonadia bacterium]